MTFQDEIEKKNLWILLNDALHQWDAMNEELALNKSGCTITKEEHNALRLKIERLTRKLEETI